MKSSIPKNGKCLEVPKKILKSNQHPAGALIKIRLLGYQGSKHSPKFLLVAGIIIICEREDPVQLKEDYGVFKYRN